MNNNLSMLRAIVLVSQIGFVFAASVVIGLLAGWYLDSVTNWSPVFTTLGALAGTASGVYGCVQIVRYVMRNGRSE